MLSLLCNQGSMCTLPSIILLNELRQMSKNLKIVLHYDFDGLNLIKRIMSLKWNGQLSFCFFIFIFQELVRIILLNTFFSQKKKKVYTKCMLLLEHLQQLCHMCQMLNIWHIWHTKHKNPHLSNVPNIIFFATCYSRVTNLSWYRQVWHMDLLFFYSSFSLISLLSSPSAFHRLISTLPYSFFFPLPFCSILFPFMNYEPPSISSLPSHKFHHH